FARPIRWLVALYDKKIIPFEIAGVTTGNKTYGHRFLGSEVLLDNPGEYNEKLREQFVITSTEERKDMIIKGIESLEKNKGFHALQNNDLLEEVCNLV